MNDYFLAEGGRAGGSIVPPSTARCRRRSPTAVPLYLSSVQTICAAAVNESRCPRRTSRHPNTPHLILGEGVVLIPLPGIGTKLVVRETAAHVSEHCVLLR